MKNKSLGTLLFFVFLYLTPCVGQTVVSGRVTDKTTGEPLERAIIRLQDSLKGVMRAYAITNAEGEYRLSVFSKSDSVWVNVSFLGYGEQIVGLKNGTQRVDFDLSVESFKINEVFVKANKIWMRHDTINYSVAGFTSASDRYISDVLKKLPGISVQENGTILYNGSAINRFYIEGMNLLDGRYTVASNNIPARSVATVQILENHQPIQALKNNSFSSRAALNIKLKEDARSQWIGNATMGVGVTPLLWKAELFLMNMKKKMQTIVLYKSNNIGDDVKQELNFHSIENIYSLLNSETPFSSLQLSPPNVSKKRYFLNKTHVLSVNNLWKLAPEQELKLNLNYQNEQETQKSRSYTSWFLEDGKTIDYDERQRVETNMNKIAGNIDYIKNSEAVYLCNSLKGGYTWQNELSDRVIGTNIREKMHTPEISVQNDFNSIKNIGSRSVQIKSINKFGHLPQSLKTNSLIFDTLSDGALPLLTQQATLNDFFSSTTLSFGHQVKSWNIKYNAGVEIDVKNYNTDLSATEQLPEVMYLNRIRWNHYKTFVVPTFYFKRKRVDLEAKVEVAYDYLRAENKIYSEKSKDSYVFCNPSVAFQYKLSNLWNLNAGSSFNQQLGNFRELLTGYFMTDYRSLSVGSGQVSKNREFTNRLSLTHKNPMKALFMNVGVTYSQRFMNRMMSQEISENRIVYTSVNRSNNYRFLLVNGRFSKAIDWKNLIVSVEGGYHLTKSSVFRLESIMPFENQSFTLTPSFRLSPEKWVDIDYTLTYSYSKMYLKEKNSMSFPGLNNIKQNLTLTIIPHKSLNILLKGEHYRNQTGENSSENLYFADAEVRWHLKKVDFGIEWNNILNTKSFSQVTYSEMKYSFYRYDFRPTNIIVSVGFKFQ